MFKTDSRKGIAAAAAAVLAFTGLAVSAPAQAAVGLNVEPIAGSTYVVPVNDRMDIRVYTDGIPTDLIGSLKFKIDTDGSFQVNYETTTTSPTAAPAQTATAVGDTSKVRAAVTQNGLPTFLSLALPGATYTSASKTVTVTAFLDANNDGVANDTYVTAPVVVTFLDGDDITWTTEFAAPAVGASSLVAFVNSSNVNVRALSNSVTVSYSESVSNAVAASNSVAIAAAYSSTDGKLKATAVTSSFQASTASLWVTGTVSPKAIYTAQAYYNNIAVGSLITRTAGDIAVSRVDGPTTSKVTGFNTATSGVNGFVSVSPTATSLKVTAMAITGSAGVEDETITFTITENGAAGMDVGTVLKVGATEIKFTNAGKVEDGKFTAVTDEDGVATIEIAITGAKKDKSFKIKASIPGVVGASEVLYTFKEAAAASVAVLDMVDTSGTGALSPVLAGIAKDTSFSLNFAVLDTYGSLLTGGSHAVRLTNGNQTVSAAVVDGKATVTWPGFAANGSYDIVADVQKNGTAVANATQTLAVKIGTAGVPAAVSQTATGLGTSATPALALMTKTWKNADTRLAQSAASSLDGAKVLTGKVTDANGLAVAGADVKLAGTGLYFSVGGVLYTTDEVSVKTNASGEYSVSVYSASGGKKTVTITSGAASKSVDLYYVASAGNTGTALTITSTATGDVAAPGTTVRVTVKLVDAAGNPVAVEDGTTSSFAITVTGPGFVSTIPTKTDKNGEALVSVLLGSSDTGNLVVTATYDRDAKGTEYAAIAVTKTIAVEETTPVVDAVIGSYQGRWAVRVENAKGSTIAVKVGGNWFKYTALNDNYLFSRKSKVGAEILVKVYVDGALFNEQTITVK